MATIHFLNVNEGDCSWIQHDSGRNTVIDISAASPITIFEKASGNHNQKNYPVNPIEYLSDYGVKDIFRFILTHPDMDHMDGIKALFESFNVINFWDTENSKKLAADASYGKYSSEDWEFYQEIRASETEPKVLHLFAGSTGQYFNESSSDKDDGDGLYILAPTKDLVAEANRSKDYNDCSYVILYQSNGKRIIFAGDSAEKTWDYILENHKEEVTNVDVLVAPHHGRKTGGNRDYLDTLNPKLTLFGNAKSQYLDYDAWNRRELDHITNNQANCIILNLNCRGEIDVYVTYKVFAEKRYKNTFYNDKLSAWYIMTI